MTWLRPDTTLKFLDQSLTPQLLKAALIKMFTLKMDKMTIFSLKVSLTVKKPTASY